MTLDRGNLAQGQQPSQKVCRQTVQGQRYPNGLTPATVEFESFCSPQEVAKLMIVLLLLADVSKHARIDYAPPPLRAARAARAYIASAFCISSSSSR